MAPQTNHRSRQHCDRFVDAGSVTPEKQRQIAERAFAFWLARQFRKGSPQEDWLRAARLATLRS